MLFVRLSWAYELGRSTGGQTTAIIYTVTKGLSREESLRQEAAGVGPHSVFLRKVLVGDFFGCPRLFFLV